MTFNMVLLDQIGHVNFVGASQSETRKLLRKLDGRAADTLEGTQLSSGMLTSSLKESTSAELPEIDVGVLKLCLQSMGFWS